MALVEFNAEKSFSFNLRIFSRYSKHIKTDALYNKMLLLLIVYPTPTKTG